MARSTLHVLLILAFTLLPERAPAASLELDASAWIIHENNVDAESSGAGRPLSESGAARTPVAAFRSDGTPARLPGQAREGDTWAAAGVTAGASTMAGPGTEISIAARFRRFRFSRFTALNASTAGIMSVLQMQFTDVHSLRAAMLLDRAWYDEDDLTGNRAGAAFELVQQTASKFWLAEAIEFERRDSRDGGIGTAGRVLSVRAGYRFRELTSVAATCRRLRRTGGEGSRTLVDSLALTGAWEVFKHIEVRATVEQQRVFHDPQADRTGNTVTGVGIVYLY